MEQMKKKIHIPTIPVKNNWMLAAAYAVWIVLVLFGVVWASQLVVNMPDIIAIGAKKIMIEIMIAAGVMLVFYFLTLMPRLSVFIGSFLLMLLALISSYVYVFRGTELMPLDFTAAGTAANVAGGYSFFITPLMVAGLALWLVLMAAGLFLPKLPAVYLRRSKDEQGGIPWKKLLLYQVGLRVLAAAVLVIIAGQWQSGSQGMYIETWGNNGSKYNGYFLNFTLQMRSELVSQMPEGYTVKAVRKLEDGYGSLKKEKPAVKEDSLQQYPDILLILEESFADMRKLGTGLGTEEPVTPFWDSLSENTVKGYALASVFGGGTANSEYEVLTGNTMGFLPHGATAYQLYIHDKNYAMPWYLRSLGYSCHATHPYLASGWNRPNVYPLLGFEDFTAIDDYPQQKLMRDFVSDQEMFDYMIDRYEKRDTAKPFFLYGITMQNHGGYEYDGEGKTPRLAITGAEGKYPRAEQYLGLIHESDKAIANLLSYFKKVDRKVVVAIFGDHYPWLEMEYYNALHGGEFTSLDEQQKEYSMPFIVWTNYDSEKEEIPITSLSAMSSMIYEAAGISQPAYNRFLKDFSGTIPAWNAQGFYSPSKGKYEYYDYAEGKEKEWLRRYSYLQYNSLFDTANRSSVLFPTGD